MKLQDLLMALFTNKTVTVKVLQSGLKFDLEDCNDVPRFFESSVEYSTVSSVQVDDNGNVLVLVNDERLKKQ